MLPPDEARRAFHIAVQLLSRYASPRQLLPAVTAGPATARRHFTSTSAHRNLDLVSLDKASGSSIEAVTLSPKAKQVAIAKKARRAAKKEALASLRPKEGTDKTTGSSTKSTSSTKGADSPGIPEIPFDVSTLTAKEKEAGRNAARAILTGQPGLGLRVSEEKQKLFLANIAQEPPTGMTRKQFTALASRKTNAQLEWAVRKQHLNSTSPRRPSNSRKIVTSALLKIRAQDDTYQSVKKEVWEAEKQRRDGTDPTTLVYNYSDTGERTVNAGTSTDKSKKAELGSAAEQREIMLAEQSKAVSSKRKKGRGASAGRGASSEDPNDEDDLSEEEPALLYQKPPHYEEWAVDSGSSSIKTSVTARGIIKASDVKLTSAVPDRHMVVARLRANLTGIPFSPGVHFMQDPRTGVYNFDPSQLQSIPTPEEFAYDRVAPYSKPSTHSELADLAQKATCTYAGSTSTLTKAFSQIYFLISRSRPVNLNSFSSAFQDERSEYTFGCQLPACLEVTKNEDTGIWYVDNDKSVDAENVLSEYGVIMEKMLTLEPKDFGKLLKANEGDLSAQKAEMSTEAFYYQHGAKLMMRSQLDCYDPRLPGTGVFDIKTRACLPIRHDRANWIANSAYEISEEKGYIRSFEREDYDMLRATMLKYSMQARIGAMDGIFVAYHNTAKMFGFKYLPLTEIDEQLFGSTEMAELSFRLCVALFEGLMDEITTCFPGEKSLNVVIKHVAGSGGKAGTLAAFVQPKTQGPTAKVPIKGIYMSIDNSVDGEQVEGVVDLSPDEARRKKQEWSLEYQISTSADDSTTQNNVYAKLTKTRGEQIAMLSIAHPEGKTPMQMQALDLEKYGPSDGENGTARPNWTTPNSKQLMLRRESKESARDHRERMKGWKKGYETGLSWTPVGVPEVSSSASA